MPRSRAQRYCCWIGWWWRWWRWRWRWRWWWWCTDLIDMKVTLDGQLRRCADNCSVWLDLITSDINSHHSLPTVSLSSHVTAAASALQRAPKLSPTTPPSTQNPSDSGPMPTMTFNCIADSLIWVSRGQDSRLLNEDSTEVSVHGLPDCLKSADHVQVLCTGSLHLVGDILSLLDPFICDNWAIGKLVVDVVIVQTVYEVLNSCVVSHNHSHLLSCILVVISISRLSSSVSLSFFHFRLKTCSRNPFNHGLLVHQPMNSLHGLQVQVQVFIDTLVAQRPNNLIKQEKI